MIFTGANTYTGNTIICACTTLPLGTLSSMGSILGTVGNEGIFNVVNANTSGITNIRNIWRCDALLQRHNGERSRDFEQ